MAACRQVPIGAADMAKRVKAMMWAPLCLTCKVAAHLFLDMRMSAGRWPPWLPLHAELTCCHSNQLGGPLVKAGRRPLCAGGHPWGC